MGSDRSMMVVLLYILIAIMAFVFAVTTNNTIVKEAAVIGTAGFRLYKKRTSGTLHDTAASGHGYSSGDRKCSGLYHL